MSLINTNNWQISLQTTKQQTTQGNPPAKIAIPPIAHSIPGFCRLILVKCANSTAPSNWRQMGIGVVSVPVRISGIQNEIAALPGSHKIPLNGLYLIDCPSFNTGVVLTLFPYPWINKFTLWIYQYTLPIDTGDYADVLAEINSKVTNINNLFVG